VRLRDLTFALESIEKIPSEAYAYYGTGKEVAGHAMGIEGMLAKECYIRHIGALRHAKLIECDALINAKSRESIVVTLAALSKNLLSR
jgi:hypothetical protein